MEQMRLKASFLEMAEAVDPILCMMFCGEGNGLDLKVKILA